MPTISPDYQSSKVIEPGDEIAHAKGGRPANGPGEFKTVTGHDKNSNGRTLTFDDGSSVTIGVATKLFVRKPDTELVEKPKQEADPLGDVPSPLVEMPYRELVDLARQEKKDANAAKEAGRKAPTTRYRDALEARHGNGESYAKARKVNGNGTTKAKAEKPPAPKVSGFRAVGLRSDKHADLVLDAIAGRKVKSYTDGLWFMVANDEAQVVADKLATRSAELAKVIYDARLLTASYVMVRLGFPKVTGSKRGAGDKAVGALHAAAKAGTIDEWRVGIRLDGTLTWKVVTNGETEELGAREVVARFAA